jgi:hypothetical protein
MSGRVRNVCLIHSRALELQCVCVAISHGSGFAAVSTPRSTRKERTFKMRMIGHFDERGQPSRAYLTKLKTSLQRGIRRAQREQNEIRAEGKPVVEVTMTIGQLLFKLERNGYRCALTGLPFWSDDGDKYGPSSPSIDRIEPKGDYSEENTRVVFLGVNSARGEGSDADLYGIAEALLEHRGRVLPFEPAPRPTSRQFAFALATTPDSGPRHTATSQQGSRNRAPAHKEIRIIL